MSTRRVCVGDREFCAHGANNCARSLFWQGEEPDLRLNIYEYSPGYDEDGERIWHHNDDRGIDWWICNDCHYDLLVPPDIVEDPIP